MAISLFDNEIFQDLMGDGEIRELMSEARQIRDMLEVEAALAEALAAAGIIPSEPAARIAATARGLHIAPSDFAASTAEAGVPVLALVRALKAALAPEDSDYVHWGATSQDILDSAQALSHRQFLNLLDRRLDSLVEQLEDLTELHRHTVMAARTRGQQAVPTTFGLKAAGWLAPFGRHRARLAHLRPALLQLQLGGAGGTLAAWGDRGLQVAGHMAATLDLSAAVPWHTARDNIADFAHVLALISGSLGKIGGDIALMAQSELGEVSPSGGGSSAMPQKNNAIGAEVLSAGARLAAAQLQLVHQGLAHEHERGGVAWLLEWAALPQLMALAGGGLAVASRLLVGMDVDRVRLRANIGDDGLILSEAAVYALAEFIPRGAAQELVKQAVGEVGESGDTLFQVLAGLSDAPVNWSKLADPANYLGVSDALIDRILAEFA